MAQEKHLFRVGSTKSDDFFSHSPNILDRVKIKPLRQKSVKCFHKHPFIFQLNCLTVISSLCLTLQGQIPLIQMMPHRTINTRFQLKVS